MESDLVLSLETIVTGVWLSLRVGGLWITLPVFGSSVLPVRQRLLLTVACTVLLMFAIGPKVQVPEPGTAAFWLGGVLELGIGMMIGFVLRLAFEAMLLAAELISLAMGLGFAQMNDPLRGTSAPVLGSVFSVTTTLVFLSLDGHLRMLEWLTWSYIAAPSSSAFFANALLDSILQWSGWMFVHAVQVAMPAMVALLIVNIGFGVISRSAPSLNLLAVGFPAALLLGLLIVLIMVPILVEQSEAAMAAGIALIADLLG